MHIENIRTLLEKITSCAVQQIENGTENVDTKEMGAVVDMIKDLSDAEYHARISAAMEKEDETEESEAQYALQMLRSQDEESRRYYDHYRYANGRFAPSGHGTRRGYDEPPYYHMSPSEYRDYAGMSDAERMRDLDRANGRMYYTEPSSATYTRDAREGRSGMSRRSYMESKELHSGNTPQDKEAKMKELDTYMNELSEDMKDLIKDMSPEERTMLKQKITKLSTLV